MAVEENFFFSTSEIIIQYIIFKKKYFFPIIRYDGAFCCYFLFFFFVFAFPLPSSFISLSLSPSLSIYLSSYLLFLSRSLSLYSIYPLLIFYNFGQCANRNLIFMFQFSYNISFIKFCLRPIQFIPHFWNTGENSFRYFYSH